MRRPGDIDHFTYEAIAVGGFLESGGHAIWAMTSKRSLDDARMQASDGFRRFLWIVDNSGLAGAKVYLPEMDLLFDSASYLNERDKVQAAMYRYVGNKFLGFLGALESYDKQETREQLNKRQGSVTMTSVLTPKFIDKGGAVHMRYPKQIDITTARVASDAFQTIVGFLAFHFPLGYACNFCRNMDLEVEGAAALLKTTQWEAYGTKFLVPRGGFVVLADVSPEECDDSWKDATDDAIRARWIHKRSKFPKIAELEEVNMLFTPDPKIDDNAKKLHAYALVGERFLGFQMGIVIMKTGGTASTAQNAYSSKLCNSAYAQKMLCLEGVTDLIVHGDYPVRTQGYATVAQAIVGWLYIKQGHGPAVNFAEKLGIREPFGMTVEEAWSIVVTNVKEDEAVTITARQIAVTTTSKGN